MSSTSDEKLTQRRILYIKYAVIALITGIILYVALTPMFSGDSEPVSNVKNEGLKNEQLNKVSDKNAIEEKWRKASERRQDDTERSMNEHEKELEDLKEENKKLKDAIETGNAKMTEYEKNAKATTDFIDSLYAKYDEINKRQEQKPTEPTAKKGTPTFTPPKPPQVASYDNKAPLNNASGYNFNSNDGSYVASGTPGSQQQVAKVKGSGITRIIFDKKSEKKASGSRMVIPMGFATGITLTGGDMPTLNWGQNEPKPIAISVESSMVTAGGVEVDIRDCMLLSSMHGEVSSERGIGVFTDMECRDGKKNLYFGKVQGYIIGDEGKIGMKGRLVTREGTVITQTMLVGFISALGDKVKAQATQTDTTTYGVMETVRNNQTTQYAIGSGIKDTTDELKDYYLKFLDQIYPVVEILPGRRVTVFFKGGSVLEKVGNSLENRMTYSDYQPEGGALPSPAQPTTPKGVIK